MDSEKQHEKEAMDQAGYVPDGHDEEVGIVNKSDPLARDLQGRHMQMIAIGMVLRAPFCPFFMSRALDICRTRWLLPTYKSTSL